jgi:hypothetical protein
MPPTKPALSAARDPETISVTPAGWTSIKPCLPMRADHPPSGPDWLHEVKHDGFRIIAHREGERVRLLTRGGYNWADRYTLVVTAVTALAVGHGRVLWWLTLSGNNRIIDVFFLCRMDAHQRLDRLDHTLCEKIGRYLIRDERPAGDPSVPLGSGD